MANFFEQQQQARRRTALLLVLYLLCVAFLVMALYALFLSMSGGLDDFASSKWERLWRPQLFLFSLAATVFVVGFGSLYKVMQLRSGGEAVAQLLGGKRISPDTTDPDERRALNVVEEMAVASGIPIPPLFILADEVAINGFAAGYEPSRAVIGLSSGAIHQLSRDELQGVVAHEFSHIFNGDMRLNIRLMGILHGILLLALIGHHILRMEGRSRRNRDRSGIAFLGVGLLVIGYVGVFFGRLIKSAVSRQREFLADSSAVQYTRNPSGIAGALRKIAEQGSALDSESAEEASHLFFADGVPSSLLHLFATHPPLRERIRRIEGRIFARGSVQEGPLPRPSGDSAGISQFAAAPTPARTVHQTRIVDRIGQIDSSAITQAAELLAELPLGVRSRTKDAVGAVAIIVALLAPEGVEAELLRPLTLSLGAELPSEVVRLLGLVPDLDVRHTLPLLDLVIPVLRQLSDSQRLVLRDLVEALIARDRKITLREYAIRITLSTELFESRSNFINLLGMDEVESEVRDLLRLLSAIGARSEEEERTSYERALARAGLGVSEIAERRSGTLRDLPRVLQLLRDSDFDVRERVVSAAAVASLRDGTVTVQEAEFFRVVSLSLGCPMPVFPTVSGPSEG